MKKVIFIVTLIMMMAFSGLCFAADGNDLNLWKYSLKIKFLHMM